MWYEVLVWIGGHFWAPMLLYFHKGKYARAIRWLRYPPPPPFQVWLLLSLEWSTSLDNVVYLLSFRFLFLDPHQTTCHSHVGMRLDKVNESYMCTLSGSLLALHLLHVFLDLMLDPHQITHHANKGDWFRQINQINHVYLEQVTKLDSHQLLIGMIINQCKMISKFNLHP